MHFSDFNFPKAITLSGASKSGKDSFFRELFKLFPDKFVRFGLADHLKYLINLAVVPTRLEFGKEDLRQTYVSFSEPIRKISNGQYFWKQIDHEVQKQIKLGKIPVITDLRFDEYETDEYFWARKILDAKMIFIKRLDKRGSVIPPANWTERKNNKKLVEKCDNIFIWETFDNPEDITKAIFNYVIKEFGKQE